MSSIRKEVPIEYNEAKIREFLKQDMKLSSRLIKGAAIDKRILVNGKPVKMNHKIFTKDIIEVIVSKKESQNIEPEKMDLDIVYEDEDILVVNKPPNIVVHPTRRHPNGTLANGVINYFRETNQDCIVRLVSRLDMDTSGLIIIAKNQYSHMALSQVMKSEDLEKRYIAVVHGKMPNDEGTVNAPIYKTEDGIRRVIDERGQKSITHYKVLENYKNGQVVECLLETGRTHQIRVHLSSLGCPIYGDTLYGDENDNIKISRQALHAYKLDFNSPRTGKRIHLKADLPKDIKELIKELS